MLVWTLDRFVYRFFFQAEDGIRDLVRSRGLGDVYKRQVSGIYTQVITIIDNTAPAWTTMAGALDVTLECSDAAGIALAQAAIPFATDNCDVDVANIVEVAGAFVPGMTLSLIHI